MSEQIRFFLPGPIFVSRDVEDAMIAPAIGHRGAEMAELYQAISTRLRGVFRTSGVTLLITCSGSLCWDIVIRSAIAGSLLNLCNGGFSERFHVVTKHRAGGTLTTPAIPQIRALDRQLDRILAEGLEARWLRHRQLRRRTEEWAARNSLEYASQQGVGSPTVSCLMTPAGLTAPEVVAALRERGYIVGGGYGKWRNHTYRIGHMGEVQRTDLDGLLKEIEQLL